MIVGQPVFSCTYLEVGLERTQINELVVAVS